MIKLVASDVDGTLLPRGEERLSGATLRTVQALVRRGVLFVAASGRSYSELRRLFGSAGDEMAFICSDGALTMYRGRALDERPMDGRTALRLYAAAVSRSPHSVLLSGRATGYFMARHPLFEQKVRTDLGGHAAAIGCINEVREPVLKFALFGKEEIPDDDAMVQKALALGLRQAYGEGPWREFVAPGVDKGAALGALRRRFGFSKDECMAFGDNLNDMEMMEQVGFDYAMAQGKEALRAVCRYQTENVVKTLSELFDLEV